MDKGAWFAERLRCDVCRGYVAACMETPIRCPGMDYREIDGRLVPYTSTGIPWDEYIQGFADRDKKRKEEYVHKYREHLTAHGTIKG